MTWMSSSRGVWSSMRRKNANTSRAGVGFAGLMEHLPGGDVEGGEQVHGAAAAVVMGHGACPARFDGQRRSRAWTWVFSSKLNTTARSGGLRYNPIGELGLEVRIVGQLEHIGAPRPQTPAPARSVPRCPCPPRGGPPSSAWTSTPTRHRAPTPPCRPRSPPPWPPRSGACDPDRAPPAQHRPPPTPRAGPANAAPCPGRPLPPRRPRRPHPPIRLNPRPSQPLQRRPILHRQLQHLNHTPTLAAPTISATDH